VIEDNKPAHWPKMQGDPIERTEQDAIRALTAVRKMIVAYWDRDKLVDDWRPAFAQSAGIVDVVAGLIADAIAIDELRERADSRARKLGEENERLKEALAESKRPFSAQMEMQNRRIIALTEELDLLKRGRGAPV
jgi:hypothetical protein